MPSVCDAAPETEKLFKVLISSLLLIPELVHPGVIIDAGANNGDDACLYAEIAGGRSVWAIEPLGENVAYIEAKYVARLPNLRVMRGGLASKNGVLELPSRFRSPHHTNISDLTSKAAAQAKLAELTSKGPHKHHRPGEEVELINISTVDTLLASWEARLALAHWDVEGMEADVLQGAARTLANDRPVFTIEVYPNTKSSQSLLTLEAARATPANAVQPMPIHRPMPHPHRHMPLATSFTWFKSPAAFLTTAETSYPFPANGCPSSRPQRFTSMLSVAGRCCRFAGPSTQSRCMTWHTVRPAAEPVAARHSSARAAVKIVHAASSGTPCGCGITAYRLTCSGTLSRRRPRSSISNGC